MLNTQEDHRLHLPYIPRDPSFEGITLKYDELKVEFKVKYLCTSFLYGRPAHIFLVKEAFHLTDSLKLVGLLEQPQPRSEEKGGGGGEAASALSFLQQQQRSETQKVAFGGPISAARSAEMEATEPMQIPLSTIEQTSRFSFTSGAEVAKLGLFVEGFEDVFLEDHQHHRSEREQAIAGLSDLQRSRLFAQELAFHNEPTELVRTIAPFVQYLPLVQSFGFADGATEAEGKCCLVRALDVALLDIDATNPSQSERQQQQHIAGAKKKEGHKSVREQEEARQTAEMERHVQELEDAVMFQQLQKHSSTS